MLYPVMPLFLQSIGFSSLLIGILEGVAEATAGLSKGYFGRLSDSTGRRLPFVQLGYALSSIAKPMLAVFTHPLWIFGARTTDKLGKGFRTAARDAILSDESTPENKGKVFGFHRAMDTLGAAIGPALALVFLIYYPGQYKLLFLITFAPALLSVLLTFSIKEKKLLVPPHKTSFKISQIFNYLKTANRNYKVIASILLLFALFNSSDVFLLLKIKQSGLSDSYVIGIYIIYNLIYALASFPLGQLADKFGLKNTMVAGFAIFVIVYLGFGLNASLVGFAVFYVLYGLYMAATEGVSKALLSNLVPKSETASAIGTYAGLSSLVALVSSTTAGLIWKYVSPEAVFIFSAVGAAIATVMLLSVKLNKEAGS
jgi:MFS family permease